MNIQTLMDTHQIIQKQMDEVAASFPFESQSAYLGWLAQSYEYVRYSTRILALTAGHFPLEMTKESNRFVKHAAEEKNHDQLLVRDAKALGANLFELPVLPEAEAFHKSLYFWIYQGKPSVILGWVLFLEGFAIRNAHRMAERAVEAHGGQAATFLSVHANEDPDHFEKAIQAIEGLNPKYLNEINHGQLTYSKLYENMLRETEAQSQNAITPSLAA